MNNVKLCHLVAGACEAAHDVFVEHVLTNRGLIPHAYFADFIPYLFGDWASYEQCIQDVSNLLESALVEYEEEVGNIIVVSFVENVDDADWEKLVRLVSVPTMVEARKAFGW